MGGGGIVGKGEKKDQEDGRDEEEVESAYNKILVTVVIEGE